MSKKLIRLTEGDLHKIMKESVHKILREMDGEEFEDEFAEDRSKQQETKLKDEQARSEGKEPYYFISDTYRNDGSFIKVWLRPEQLVDGRFKGKRAY